MTREPQRYEYALLQVMPRPERGELVNAGLLLYCRPLRSLVARVHFDRARVRALDPGADLDAIETSVKLVAAICAGDPDAGPAAAEEIGRRFRWLTAPRSTVVRAGPVHSGFTASPDAEADRLLALLVLPPG
ncbi:DUF3037 domain-containing protein [Amycolatopsis sp. CA-230715]|uniref:DUF3037 domain-containing protein n=1 Tax=Amycolatopsis sp. CA-230715 TaxID=2745196 RepID=UPI001C3226CC|nr:DUF3037 domain-containing protein [Amycolatopsis sp. CA-230715]QWF84371.1 hypothetical protein HUW46_07821 [Amycolatopsis sp. CA-230715]